MNGLRDAGHRTSTRTSELVLGSVTMDAWIRPARSGCVAVVGRDVEQKALGDALDDADCNGVVLVGAGGVREVPIVATAMDRAVARGMSVVAVRSTRSRSNVPFAALVPLFDELGVAPDLDHGLVARVTGAVDSLRGTQRMTVVVDLRPGPRRRLLLPDRPADRARGPVPRAHRPVG